MNTPCLESILLTSSLNTLSVGHPVKGISSISWSLTNQLNLYIPEFDNLKNEESLEWLSSGFVDILSKKFNEVDGVRVYGRSALEKILQDKSILLTQRVGTKNILLMECKVMAKVLSHLLVK